MRRTNDHLEPVLAHDAVRTLAGALDEGRRVAARGAAGSSSSLLAGAVARLTGRPVLLVLAHQDDSDESVDELSALGLRCARFPALEHLAGESSISLELLAERLSLVRALSEADNAPLDVIACPIHALMQGVPAPGDLDALSLVLRPGRPAPAPDALAEWLASAGFTRADAVAEPGEFSVRGGIIDVFPLGGTVEPIDGGPPAPLSGAVRLDFFGDELEAINEVDLDTMGSDRRLGGVHLVAADPQRVLPSSRAVTFLDALPAGTVALLAEPMEVIEQGRGYYERAVDASGLFGPPAVLKALEERAHALAEVSQFSPAAAGADTRVDLPARPLPEFPREASEGVAELGALSEERRVLVLCANDAEARRFGELAREFAPDRAEDLDARAAYLHRGFLWGEEGEDGATAFVPYHELLHRYQARRRAARLRSGRTGEAFYEIEPGDIVVHADHGIAKYLGLHSMAQRGPKQRTKKDVEARLKGASSASKRTEEFLTLEFAGRSKLHVPVAQIDKVQRYVGGFRGKPPLSTLGGKKWQNQKEKTAEAVRDLAAELLRVQAARENLPGVRFPEDTAWQHEFEAEFPYEETEDQLAALSEIKKDMGTGRPMDRLICGDVGYGKTEVAIRAAFKAAEFGKQVAVLVPTTLLAEQHARTFRARFADYPFRVESLSRFKGTADVKRVLEEVRKGHVDILIGTHRILSQDVRFADLGLVIVDEEQRFGVEHKQALLRLRMTADVLTLSATPIPRTLHMSMLGLRSISSLATPPIDRRAVVTEVMPYNEQRIARAIRRELDREGQVYFVHNRVHNIRTVADDVQRLAPDARIVIGHGQMPDGELEKVMRAFVDREADILVSTTIIESGIDIPTANTMFINEADIFGLADLHQLRGRVGRHKHRAYCYLLLPPDRQVSETATRRLRALEEYSMLGAGFKIAMRDLEIRGAGNILGPEQSGHIAAVGYDMYCRLLDQASKELRNEETAETWETTVDLGLPWSIPRAYIPSEPRRLEAYRRLAAADDAGAVDTLQRDLVSAYGEPPSSVSLLLDQARLRALLADLRVRSLTLHGRDVVISCEDPSLVRDALGEAKGSLRVVRPVRDPTSASSSGREEQDETDVYWRPPESYLDEPASLLRVLLHRLGEASGQPAGA